MDVWHSKWSHVTNQKPKSLYWRVKFLKYSVYITKMMLRKKSLDKRGCINDQYQKVSSLSEIMIRKQIYHSHKRTLWMEEPISISQRKESNRGGLRRQIFIHKRSIKSMLIAWEWGTNEYICLTLWWSCGVISRGN